MQSDQLADYIKNAIQRAKDGKLSSDSGSHVVGVFGKAANGFEKEVRFALSRLLQSCGLNYAKDVKNSINPTSALYWLWRRRRAERGPG